MSTAALLLLKRNEYISRTMPSQHSFSQNQKTVFWDGNGDRLHGFNDDDADFDSDSDSDSGLDKEGIGCIVRRKMTGVATRQHASARYAVIIALVQHHTMRTTIDFRAAVRRTLIFGNFLGKVVVMMVVMLTLVTSRDVAFLA